MEGGGYGLNDNLNKYKELFSCIFDGAMLWNIAIYVRLSKDDGNSVSLSIVNQIKKISRYLKNFKDFIIYDIYIDGSDKIGLNQQSPYSKGGALI